LHDKPGIDRGDGEIADQGIDIGFERRAPLRRMLCTPPARPVLFDVLDGALAEGPTLGDRNPLREPLGCPVRAIVPSPLRGSNGEGLISSLLHSPISIEIVRYNEVQWRRNLHAICGVWCDGEAV
jgi:hypothetical protein